jgi:hypothetical protein
MLAQTKSHRTSQQIGSDAQTRLQHDESLHAGLSCAVQQSPAHSSPHSTPQRSGQSVLAWLAHVVSHPASQHTGSAAHTTAQQDSSSHAGARCASQQLPVALPHVGTASGHEACAICTHTSSQAVSQQKTSCWHTEMQQSPCAQPPVGLGTKQEPEVPTPHPLEQRSSAYSTQNESHAERQQNGSCAHTVAQHDGSSQYGVSCARRHDPLHPLPHPGSPQHSPRASDTHSASHSTTQHVGSVLHTTAQHVLSSQPPLACVSKQDPAHGQRQVPNGRQVVRASVTHAWSHLSLQHEGSCAHTPLQQATSAQPGALPTLRQSPSPGHVLAAMHTTSASAAHPSSHATRQHARSTLQTEAEHFRLAHPRPPWAARQSPTPEPVGGRSHDPSPAAAALNACCTQIASHCTEQQNGSRISQTTSQHAPAPVPSQPGTKLGTKHGRVPVLPHVEGAVPHSDWAISTQSVSHASVQQKTSALQTVTQQARSAQPGVTCVVVHSPAKADPHPSHSEATSLTHATSHEIVQHSGRSRHTASQQPPSSQPGEM